MSIAINDVSRIVQYTATGSQTQFTVPFPFLEDADVKAYKRASGTTGDDTTDILTITTDYTLTGAGQASGGTLTLTSGATVGDIVTIVGDDSIERTSYYTTNPTIDGFNEDFEKQTIFNRLNETLRAERMLSYQRSETIADKDRDIPPLSPLHCWRMNEGGTAIESVEIIDEEGAAPRTASYIVQTANTLLSNEQALADLSSGYMKSTTGTGVVSTVAAIDVADIEVNNLSGATYTGLDEVINFFGSAGYVSGGAITDNGDGTVDIAAGTGFVRTTDSDIGELITFDWPATAGLTMTDGDETYIYVDYNGGVPQVSTTGSGSNIDYNTEFDLFEVAREGTVLHISDHKQLMKDVPSVLQQYLYSKNRIERADAEGGLILDESADTNRYVTMTAGSVWIKLDKTALTAKDTDPAGDADTFDSYYQDGGGGWTKVTGGTQWNNTQIDDGSGSLLTMTNNRYAAQYFYIDSDDELVHIYGQNQYVTLAGVSDEGPPSSLPTRLGDHSLLIGRILFQKSATTAEEVESAFDTSFSGTLVTNHANLTGLTTGDAGHTQFALLAGRSGGQTLIGGTDANDDLTLQTTSNATKGDYIFSELTTNGVAKIDGSGVLSVSAQLELADGGTGIDSSGATDGQLLIGGTSSNDLQLGTLTAGTGISIVNGTNSVTVSATASSDWVHLNTQTASASASIIFDNTYITDTYDIYKLYLYSVLPAAATTEDLLFEVSNDNGSTWRTSGYSRNATSFDGSSTSYLASITASSIYLAIDTDGQSSADKINGEYCIYAPTDSSVRTAINGSVFHYSNGANLMDIVSGRYNTAEDNDAIRIRNSSGNITSGTFVLYGLKTS